MEEKYIKARELANLWDITPRRINQLCADNILPGAYKDGKFWMIPSNIEKPASLRGKQVKTVKPLAKTLIFFQALIHIFDAKKTE